MHYILILIILCFNYIISLISHVGPIDVSYFKSLGPQSICSVMVMLLPNSFLAMLPPF